MATIKGQNLRVLMGADVGSEYCVIQATSCTAHVTMNVQESSTKDDTDGWVRNDITGMSWDITSEAQVSLSQFTMEASVSTGKTASGVKYRTATPIRLNKGQEITYCIDTSIPGATDKPCGIINVDGTVLSSFVPSTITSKSYVSPIDQDVYLTAETVAPVKVINEGVGTDELVQYMKDKTLLSVIFAKTSGEQNREEDEEILTGRAYISDISIQAANRQTATATVKLIGSGDLELVDN